MNGIRLGIAIVAMVIVMSTGFMAYGQEPEVVDLGPVRAALRSQALRADVEALPAISSENRIATFKQLIIHRNDASVINRLSSNRFNAVPGAFLSVEYVKQLGIYLRETQRLTDANGSPALNESFFSRDQAWGVLRALEEEGWLKEAKAFAQQMANSEAEADAKALLRLVQARCTWLLRAGEPKQDYWDAFNVAAESANEEISAAAALWRRAITRPTDFESLALSHQIWKTCVYNRAFREKSQVIKRSIVTFGRPIYDEIKASAAAGEAKNEQLLTALAILSEAGHQNQDIELIKWAVQEGLSIERAPSELTLTPRYFLGVDYFSRQRYDEALNEFLAVCGSGVKCDLAADAGKMLASCYRGKYDNLSALAALDIVLEDFPEQIFVRAEAFKLKDLILEFYAPAGDQTELAGNRAGLRNKMAVTRASIQEEERKARAIVAMREQ